MLKNLFLSLSIDDHINTVIQIRSWIRMRIQETKIMRIHADYRSATLPLPKHLHLSSNTLMNLVGKTSVKLARCQGMITRKKETGQDLISRKNHRQKTRGYTEEE
jgi:hypothetical protein